MSRRQLLWLLLGGVIACSWCSLLSGAGGWLMGYDLGRRETRAELLPDTGVLVVRVERGGPADLAGIGRNDTIIAVNGSTVEDIPALRATLARYRPGDEVTVAYRHDTGEQMTRVRLGRFPGSDQPYLGIYYTARAEEPADL